MGVEFYGVLWESKKGFKILIPLGKYIDITDMSKYDKVVDDLMWFFKDEGEAEKIMLDLEDSENTCSPDSLSGLLAVYRKAKSLVDCYKPRLLLYLALMRMLKREPKIIPEYELEEGRYAML